MPYNPLPKREALKIAMTSGSQVWPPSAPSAPSIPSPGGLSAAPAPRPARGRARPHTGALQLGGLDTALGVSRAGPGEGRLSAYQGPRGLEAVCDTSADGGVHVRSHNKHFITERESKTSISNTDL